MKKSILFIAFLLHGLCYAQVGVITINEDDYLPEDQWYLVRGEEHEDIIFYYSDFEICKEVIDKILEGYDITFIEGGLNEDGSLAWVLDHLNGFISTMRFYPNENYAIISIYTYKDEPDNSLNK
jgi:hypothetical protein